MQGPFNGDRGRQDDDWGGLVGQWALGGGEADGGGD